MQRVYGRLRPLITLLPQRGGCLRIGVGAYAVVSFGGCLSMGEKLFASPFSAFKYDVAENEYVLDVSKERLEAAPRFDADHWPSMAEEKWNRDVYKYYERSPYWE